MLDRTAGTSGCKLFSYDVAHPQSKGYATHATREAALSAAYQSHWTYPVSRIEGPNGEVLSTEDIGEYCRNIRQRLLSRTLKYVEEVGCTANGLGG